MTDMDPVQMQVDMIKAQVETQKNMYRQMYASDPAMAEQFCEQLDKNMQLQIEMIRQMMGAAGDGGYVDPVEQARIAMEHLGYSDDEMSQVLGGDGGDSLTERILGDKDPSEFGYGDIIEAISSISELGEPQPAPADPERMRRFEVLLTGIISTLNDHLLDGLDVEPRDQDSRDVVYSILRDYWGVESREELVDVLKYLMCGGHTADYVNALEVISGSGTAEDLHTEEMDEEDIAVSDARFAFAQAYAGSVDPAMMLGWDLGRAANVTRWGYFLGYLSEDEAWSILDQIADGCMDAFDGWVPYAQSYIFGSMFWKCPYGPEACFENMAGLMFAVEHLLTEGEWKDFPWASGRA